MQKKFKTFWRWSNVYFLWNSIIMPPKCCVQVEHVVLAFDYFVILPVHPSKLGHAQKAKFKTNSFWRKLRPPLNISLYFLRPCFFVGFVLFVLCCFFILVWTILSHCTNWASKLSVQLENFTIFHSRDSGLQGWSQAFKVRMC